MIRLKIKISHTEILLCCKEQMIVNLTKATTTLNKIRVKIDCCYENSLLDHPAGLFVVKDNPFKELMT